jgi:hypothetical protein
MFEDYSGRRRSLKVASTGVEAGISLTRQPKYYPCKVLLGLVSEPVHHHGSTEHAYGFHSNSPHSDTTGPGFSVIFSRKCLQFVYLRSQDSSVGIVRATGWTARVRFSTVQEFSFLHNVKTSSVAHLASYPMGTGLFLRG